MNEDVMLDIRNVSVRIDNRLIVDDVSFSVFKNDFLMLIGPNGAGKSTLIKAIMQVYAYSGCIYLEGSDISGFNPKTIATRVGVLAQTHQPQFQYKVYDLVSLGRYAYQRSLFGVLGKDDKKKIEEALVVTGMEKMAYQSVLTLSGGELQRVYLAQLLAQDPHIMILDEPATHLDIKYQITLFEIIREWAKSKGKAVMAVVHDLNTVYSYGTKALLMHEGKVYKWGETSDVLTRENLKAVYTVDVAQWMQDLMKHWEK